MDYSSFIAHRKTVRTPGGEIAYTDIGSGPAALFVHGIGTNGLIWRQVIERLSDTSRCVAIDLPLHGATPVRDDLSIPALAGVVMELCAALELDRVDLVGNDTGGAVAQIVAADHPELLRSLTLTNCDTEDNLPPEAFQPVVDLAVAGKLAPLFATALTDPQAVRGSALGSGYEDPGSIPDDVLMAYATPVAGTLDRARHFERLLASLDAADLKDAGPRLRKLDVPTLIVWGTGDEIFGIEWAHWLRDTIPGAGEVVEVRGGRLFFPEERPDELVPHLRRHWGR